MAVQVGIARADVTPPIDIPMVGFAGRAPASDVHDPLYATALVFADGDVTAALVVCDLLQFKAETVAAFRAAVEEASGVAEANVTFSCTHNHYGPSVDRSDAPIVAAYAENLKFQFAGIVKAAKDALQPVKMGVGWGECDIAINRRERRDDGVIVLGNNWDGPVDRALGVLRIDDADGDPLACLANFACHPVSQTGRMAELSADFPGRACNVVEELVGGAAVFLQGACGDLNPVRMENAYEPARVSGTKLGCEIVNVWEEIETAPVEGLALTSNTVQLPRYMYGSLAAAEELVAELDEQIARLEERDPESGSMWWAKLRRERACEAVESWKSGEPLATVEAELQAWRIGDVGFVSAPGEIFTENGAFVKNGSPFTDTFFLGYTNGSIGYVPTRQAYPEGGYEVTHACQVDPDAGDIINDGCLELLNDLG